MDYTPNFNLAKPVRGFREWTEFINDNWDVIDTELEKIETQPPQSGVASFSSEYEKTITFDTAFSAAPIVVATPVGENVGWWVSEVSTTGFKLHLGLELTGDVNWIAMRKTTT